jgi:hypothetical protein
MTTYEYKPKENCDLCHFVASSEKEYGVQCVILKSMEHVKQYTAQQTDVIKTLCDGRGIKDLAFLHIAPPGKSFESFDYEKNKLMLVPKAYLKLLEFFNNDCPGLMKKMEADHQSLKSKIGWHPVKADTTIRGPADIVYTSILDVTHAFVLKLTVLKRIDTGKTSMTLAYSDEAMGSVHLPPQPFSVLCHNWAFVSGLYNYKDPVPSKKSRQS